MTKAIAMVIAVTVLCSLWSGPVSASVTRRCYTISGGNTTVYSNTGLTRKYIYSTGEDNGLPLSGRKLLWLCGGGGQSDGVGNRWKFNRATFTF